MLIRLASGKQKKKNPKSMALLIVSKKKARDQARKSFGNHHQSNNNHICPLLCRFLYRIPVALLFLMLILIWSSSTTIMSGSFVHLCISSRKLNNLYCLSAGTQPNLEIPPLPAVTNNSTNFVNGYNSTNKDSSNNILIESTDHEVNDSKRGNNYREIWEAKKTIKEQLQLHRSWIISPDSINSDGCNGRGIFVYDLPSKFNKELLELCSDMIPWTNFCYYVKNDAMGEQIPALGNNWYHTHQYALEPIFHSRVLKHPCRVHKENEARLFYVPYYGGLDILRWHFKDVTEYVKDALALDLMNWLHSQPTWARNAGKDHVFVLGKISWDFRRNEQSSWGSRLLELDQMQNPLKLLIERQPWHSNDIGVPHPTYFHPHTDKDIVEWQFKIIRSKRENLVSFAGAARPDDPTSIRSLLINQCTSCNASSIINNDQNKKNCNFLDCKSGGCERPEAVVELFMKSEFCLQPPGDSPTRKSVFDSLVAGCIPVLFDPFTAYYQYPWHLPEDHSLYSVFIDQEEVRNMEVDVVERLMKVPLKEREHMRRYIVYELLPGLVYGDSSSELEMFQDAFSISINNMLHHVTTLLQSNTTN